MRGAYLATVIGTHVRKLGYRLRGISPELAYWHERAHRLGANADSLISDTEKEKALYRRVLKAYHRPVSHVRRWALDYGCGTGRFTALLAETVGGLAVGVDPVPEMIGLAMERQVAESNGHNCVFDILEPTWAPHPGSMDLVASIHCLGGLHREALDVAINEMLRLCMSGGTIFVVEAASGEDSEHWRGRPASFYIKRFGMTQERVEKVRQGGKWVNLITGRKP
jgi:SAM-dependent methyltransferase